MKKDGMRSVLVNDFKFVQRGDLDVYERSEEEFSFEIVLVKDNKVLIRHEFSARYDGVIVRWYERSWSKCLDILYDEFCE